MTKSERERAQRELAHALDALGDEQSEWVLDTLEGRCVPAWSALRVAISCITQRNLWAYTAEDRAKITDAVRRIAPVLLEIVLDNQP